MLLQSPVYEKFLNFKGFYKVDLQASKEPAVTWHIEEVVDISENLDRWLISEESPADEAAAPDHTSPSLLLHAEFRDHLNSELEEVAGAQQLWHFYQEAIVQTNTSNVILMFDKELAALLSELSVEELQRASDAVKRLQAELTAPKLRQLLGFIESEK